MKLPLLGRYGEPLLSRLGRHELPILAVPGVAAAAIWIFVELADEVRDGSTREFDRALLLSLRHPDDISDPIGPRWLEELVRDVTAFGGTGPLLFITLAAILYLVMLRKYRSSLFLLLAVGGGQLLSSVLKLGFDRARPDLVPHGMHVYTASFPSGHAMMAAVTWLTLGALLARTESRLRIKAYIILLAVLITILVGLSRVYLGVHWPTDVLGGWVAGSAWAALCWAIALLLQRRGGIEEEPAPDPDGDTANRS
ncbi:MAG TPA: phosphatase PAP2 family protein [Ferrovibrio sp.]|jgi:undecaprenyl-diphosphatase|uniref:phosphatase PAP2 family protein n=1 Tax=Ferrovibrio sp. TaxID=1917215 RepID=UPI002B4B1ED1|nr:phosphatase PAP2 family protein [Ferrovibrio sp.]HLT75780.1 phosphatase PAP2 family protein [Ferrovibrio sp.]